MPLHDKERPVTILGAGIVGICTALSLRERGVPVTLIDRAEPGQSTSYGTAGVVSPWSCIPQAMPGIWKNIPKLMFGHGRPLSVHPRSAFKMIPWGLRFLYQSQRDRAIQAADAMSALCGPSIELFEKHLSGTGHEDLLVDSIYVQAFRDASKANLDGLEAHIRASKGAELEVVGRDELKRLEPALGPDFQAAVLVKGAARVRTPGRVAAVLAEKAIAMGTEFVQAEVQKISKSEAGWTLLCADGQRQADRIVICMGVWSSDLLADVSVNVPLMSERGYHAEFENPGVELNNSVLDTDAKFIASSMEGGLRVAGHAEFAPPDAPPSKRRQKTLVSLAKAMLPDLRTEDVNFWMGRRPSFPDSLPALGQVAEHEDLFLNFGHSHYGMMMAPASGDFLTRMILNESSNVSLEAFSPARF